MTEMAMTRPAADHHTLGNRRAISPDSKGRASHAAIPITSSASTTCRIAASGTGAPGVRRLKPVREVAADERGHALDVGTVERGEVRSQVGVEPDGHEVPGDDAKCLVTDRGRHEGAQPRANGTRARPQIADDRVAHHPAA